MAKLYFRYGAMGSSKTANAIMVQYNYHERGQNALMVKPRLDNRDGERIVGSRSGLSAPCIYMEELETVDFSAYNCIIVDEAQFLRKEQVAQLVQIVDEMVNMIVSQRAYESNSKAITTSDSMLEIANGLKR